MIQKTIRPYGGVQFSVAEGAELIEELNDRTASDQAGYNSTDEIATKMKLVETGKQEKLVSGTNIKTVNGNSLLGSGNISTASGFQGTIVIADTPTTDGIYRPTEEGTYTNAGGLTYLPTTTDKGYQVEFVLNGGVWSKSRVDVSMNPIGVVEEGNEFAVSGGAVTEYVKTNADVFDVSVLTNNYALTRFGGISRATGITKKRVKKLSLIIMKSFSF